MGGRVAALHWGHVGMPEKHSEQHVVAWVPQEEPKILRKLTLPSTSEMIVTYLGTYL